MLIPLLSLALAAAPLANSHGVEIVAFRPESRTLAPGGEAASELVLHNGGRRRRVWIGYSVQDPGGRWHDVPPHSLTLRAGETSAPQRKVWRVPAEETAVMGAYRVVMAVWSAPPGEEGAVRLASRDQRNAFRVRGRSWPLMEEPGQPWRAASHSLGRGALRPEQVLAHGEGFRLRLLPERCDGAELRSRDRVRYGEYTARLKTPVAPGSLSAFFLYEGIGDRSDEIDIEIYNDGSRRALLVAWHDGKMVRNGEVVLPFDPAAAYHDYTLRWGARELVFLADGRTLARWESGYPHRPMHLIANVWWPKWLECEPLPTAREMAIERILLRPQPLGPVRE